MKKLSAVLEGIYNERVSVDLYQTVQKKDPKATETISYKILNPEITIRELSVALNTAIVKQLGIKDKTTTQIMASSNRAVSGNLTLAKSGINYDDNHVEFNISRQGSIISLVPKK